MDGIPDDEVPGGGARQPLGVLSEKERESERLQRRLRDEARVTAAMLERAYQVAWQSLKAKYGLPDEVTLNEETGEVYATEESGQRTT